MNHRDTAAGLQLVSKKHFKRRETKAEGKCRFWSQTEEGWLKLWLAHERAGCLQQQQLLQADCCHTTDAENSWKGRRRFLLDKRATVVVGGRRAANSRLKEKKIILLLTVQCQKTHRAAQGCKSTGQLS